MVTVVDEKMKELVEKSEYKHPVHSFILDPTDLIWEKCFTRAEINGMITFKNDEELKIMNIQLMGMLFITN